MNVSFCTLENTENFWIVGKIKFVRPFSTFVNFCCFCHVFHDVFADDTLDVTSDPVEQELAMSSSSTSLSSANGNHSSHNPFKIGQLEVELGGSITIQCPQGRNLITFTYKWGGREARKRE